MNQINVVPYIDVMLVLLVIFMVTAPLIQVGDGRPADGGQGRAGAGRPAGGDRQGRPDAGLPRDAERKRRATSRATSCCSLVAEAQKKNPQQAVVIAGDKNVRYEAVMEVMDELQKQQVARVGLLVQQGQ